MSITARAALVLWLATWSLGFTQPDVAFPHGVASGDVSQNSAVIWARTRGPATLQAEWSRSPEFAPGEVSRVELEARREADFTVQYELVGLAPQVRYYYRFVTNSGVVSPVGTFRTAPRPGTAAPVRFAFSGDNRGDLAPFPALNGTSAQHWDFFVYLGDTIYADFPSPAVPDKAAETLEEYRAKYREVRTAVAGSNSLVDLFQSTSVYAIWDDHEVANDWAGGAPVGSDLRFGPSLDPARPFLNGTQRALSGLQAFQEYMPLRRQVVHSPGDRRMDGTARLFREQRWGRDVDLIILDNRQFRDAPVADWAGALGDLPRFWAVANAPGRTMLGETQLQFLLNSLLAAERAGVTWKFVVTAEPIQELGPVVASDRFEGYGAERTRILKFIDDNDIHNVVFLSADIHATLVNDLYYPVDLARPLGRRVPAENAFELTSGPIAFDPPFGPAVLQFGALFDVFSPPTAQFLLDLPDSTRDQVVAGLLNLQLFALGLSQLGLRDLPGIDRPEMPAAHYISLGTYGYNLVEVDGHQARFTVYGLPYDQVKARMAQGDLAAVAALVPQPVLSFSVQALPEE